MSILGDERHNRKENHKGMSDFVLHALSAGDQSAYPSEPCAVAFDRFRTGKDMAASWLLSGHRIAVGTVVSIVVRGQKITPSVALCEPDIELLPLEDSDACAPSHSPRFYHLHVSTEHAK